MLTPKAPLCSHVKKKKDNAVIMPMIIMMLLMPGIGHPSHTGSPSGVSPMSGKIAVASI